MTKVDIDLDNVYRKLSPQAVTSGRKALSSQALSDMNRYVPRREGILRQATSIDSDGSAINYHMKYARRHFYAPSGWKYTTPGTGPQWHEKAKGIHMSDWEKAFLGGAQI